ncbi:carotene isomerase [Micractinium conductrix]|uniref:Carotene isomerase n=1 Tax=Micractinium conductrix TaxID=554055 RepID=A0A2P6V6Z2_9CHLO|nr:carotene isomerase [Micractinium conductrix]|eukprot:PSC69857.1 carotene isomerase [Micractinium conductrix]
MASSAPRSDSGATRRAPAPPQAVAVEPPVETGDRSHETDIVTIGSGIGGLCAAALLARYGCRVTVLESHYLPGGAAHSFEAAGGYHFDAGPSFFAGLSGPPGKSTNPLKQVLDAVGESVECITYDKWVVYTPDRGSFECVCDAQVYADTIRRVGGEEAARQWAALEREMAPLQAGAALFPAAAIRGDVGMALTAARYGPGLLQAGLVANKLTGPFSAIVDKAVTDPWLRSFLDLECFVLSGMTAKDTICAEMAYMYLERNSGKSTIDYPLGGSGAIVDALIRGIEKHGGRVLLRSHVEEVVVEDGRATGVQLRSKNSGARPEVIRAGKAVISNASVWDTARLLPEGAVPEAWRSEGMATPRTGSFMHLHLGIDAAGLRDDLEIHHLVVNQWQDIEAPQNVINISIPSVFDPSLAPPGKHCVHVYTAGNEPYELWEGLRPGTPEYAALKEERSQCLWKALEQVIPDVRSRAELALVGTPLTHQRFLRRYKGTYGPAISAATGAFPGAGTPLPGLYRCGDSCQPGIGVPAAAASGMIAANTLSSVWDHWKLLDALGL